MSVDAPSKAGRLGALVLLISLALGAGLRTWLSFSDDGVYWPDEIYQSLEPAHRLVYGYGLVAWEFEQGARNWTFPGAVAGILAVTRTLGVDDPRHYVLVVRLFFTAIGIATAFGTYLLARSYGTTQPAAAVGGALFGLAAPAIYFAPRAMGETASALTVVLGLALLVNRDGSTRATVLGASLLGLSVLIRIHTVIFAAGVLVILLARREFGRARLAALTLCVWALLFGLIDLATWDGWFHSALTYLRFNVLEGGAARWGTSPPQYYLSVLVTSMPAIAIVCLPLAPFAVRRAPALTLLAALFFGVHTAVGHKEYRFILPLFPVLFALIAIGIGNIYERRQERGKLVIAVVLMAALVSAATFRSLTFRDIGSFGTKGPSSSAYDDSGSTNRLLMHAYHLDDLCGLKVESAYLTWTGGYSYLHRDVPLYHQTGPDRSSDYFNYVITSGTDAREGIIVERDAETVLLRIGSRCLADPTFQPRVP